MGVWKNGGYVSKALHLQGPRELVYLPVLEGRFSYELRAVSSEPTTDVHNLHIDTLSELMKVFSAYMNCAVYADNGIGRPVNIAVPVDRDLTDDDMKRVPAETLGEGILFSLASEPKADIIEQPPWRENLYYENC